MDFVRVKYIPHKVRSKTYRTLSFEAKHHRIYAETLSLKVLCKIIRRNFTNRIPITFTERGEIIPTDLDRIPKEHGIYLHWAKLNGDWIPVYFGKSEATVDSGGLRTRIKNHFLRSQKAGGPRKVYDTLRKLDIDIEWAISYVVTSKAEKYESRVLSFIDFIGNFKDNGDYRFDALDSLAHIYIDE
jgi:hypothetical protein